MIPKVATMKNVPDTVGLAVAWAAQEAVGTDTVILFGSRARGDHRPDSDVDLLVVSRKNPLSAYDSVQDAVTEFFRENPPALGCDVVPMSRCKFNYCRRAPNHVAGQAVRDGIIMNDDKLEDSGGYDDQYPTSWPDVKERLEGAYRNLRAMDVCIRELPQDQESYGFHAQQAVENALKGWISAADLRYGRTHGINELTRIILADPTESNSPAAAQLQDLLNFTSFRREDEPGETRNWLSLYAVAYRYAGVRYRMDESERETFRNVIYRSVNAFIRHAHELTGTRAEDLTS